MTFICGNSECQIHRDQVNVLLALGVPLKRLEAMRSLLEVQMVQCWVEGYDSMLGRRGWFDAGLKGWFDAG